MSRMKRSAWIILSVVVLAGVVIWLVMRARAENTVVDLVAELPNVVVSIPTKEQNLIKVADTTIAGDRKRAIVFEGNSRLAWRVAVPENAWLSLSLGMREEAYNVQGGDGIWFRVTVYDQELLSLMVDAAKNPADRRWQDFMIDLSEYAGETIDLYLKTNASPLGKNDPTGDFAAWGNPRIITR